MIFTEAELAYLASQRLGRLATAQPDGTLQVSPVGFGVNTDLGTIDIGGRAMASSRKYRNVAANGRAAFAVDDIASVQPWVVRCGRSAGRPRRFRSPATRPHRYLVRSSVCIRPGSSASASIRRTRAAVSAT